MRIKEIELYNFRLYKGLNKFTFDIDGRKNIGIISGKNGYGKTTFLMSLVWCLYGRQMSDVDQLFRKEIEEQGGYNKYISNSLNRLAQAEDAREFSVSITFTDINIPDLGANEIKIRRSFNIKSPRDRVEVWRDGSIYEIGEDEHSLEMFIRDFILPKEIAKFFFFDAEKIVSLAETLESKQRKELSLAYSEVLGIKKYEDLKQDLENLRTRLRKESATPDIKRQVNNLEKGIGEAEFLIEEHQNNIIDWEDERSRLKLEITELQNKLIKEGQAITAEELEELRVDEAKLKARLEELGNDLRASYEIIPFAIAGVLVGDVSEQLAAEAEYKANKHKLENAEEAAEKVLDDLVVAEKEFPGTLNNKVLEFYRAQFRKLIAKHFFNGISDDTSPVEVIHNFSEQERQEFDTLANSLRTSFDKTFEKLYIDYAASRNNLNQLQKRIREAEANKEDEIIQYYRDQKSKKEEAYEKAIGNISVANDKIRTLELEIVNNKKRINELTRELEVNQRNKHKDEKARELLQQLTIFTSQFKEEKKRSLEAEILKGLQMLMHKKGFIARVEVDIVDEDIDIHLKNSRGERIPKQSLSMGEKQMYATALLRGLVEESEISFPVFIDSPMQKFDQEHAANIIQHFYPSVSDQVVILPLIVKEMNEEEYKMLLPNVANTYLLDNSNSDETHPILVEPANLFQEYYNLIQNADTPEYI